MFDRIWGLFLTGYNVQRNLSVLGKPGYVSGSKYIVRVGAVNLTSPLISSIAILYLPGFGEYPIYKYFVPSINEKKLYPLAIKLDSHRFVTTNDLIL